MLVKLSTFMKPNVSKQFWLAWIAITLADKKMNDFFLKNHLYIGWVENSEQPGLPSLLLIKKLGIFS